LREVFLFLWLLLKAPMAKGLPEVRMGNCVLRVW
jgi:hypothetical protein